MGSTTWSNDEGWVSVGDVADTAEFAVESIRAWWDQMGRARFPDADRLLITADAGGSNGYRLRAWKVEPARLATDTGLDITVCHYPPGTSKWNRIEHRMFSFITMNWRGRPLTTVRTIIELISATTTSDRTHHPGRPRPASGIPPASRSATPNSPPCRSPPTTSTANGTTPSTNQTRREPLAAKFAEDSSTLAMSPGEAQGAHHFGPDWRERICGEAFLAQF